MIHQPKPYQQTAIRKAVKHYETYEKAKKWVHKNIAKHISSQREYTNLIYHKKKEEIIKNHDYL